MDFFKNKIQTNDWVLYVIPFRRELAVGKVLKITNKKVFIERLFCGYNPYATPVEFMKDTKNKNEVVVISLEMISKVIKNENIG